MRNKYIEAFENAQIATKSVPDFRAGDTLRIAIHIKEGDKSRIQNFEGVCIARRGIPRRAIHTPSKFWILLLSPSLMWIAILKVSPARKSGTDLVAI